MSFNRYRPAPSLASREMLFAGFEKNLDAAIRDFPYLDKTYYFEKINSPAEAFQWLEQRVADLETYQLPYAVFCSLEWLEADEFRFARRLREHPDLRFVPLIVFAKKEEVFEKETLIREGVDDCYAVPILWRALETRLEFLNQFKTILAEPLPREQFGYKIPPLKRVFDIVGAALGILLTSVIWLPVALAIVLESKGPIFYKSKRVGTGYRVFDFFKFRSMYVGADARLFEFQHLNQYNGGGTVSLFVKLNQDPRVTRVGRFIRKYSLDELPQLINVLRGEMSLVGNRPLPLYEAEQLTRDEWSARFLAPAGITGLWQVSRRGQADMSAEERIALDVAYSKNYSIWLDLKILLRTFGAIVQQEEG
jgi:lipopolysaccharide/colanic/teichoic acid biosynthesis glycosyltransferase